MQDFIEGAGKVLGFLLVVFGIDKIVNYNLGRRVKQLEDVPVRSVEDCVRLMDHCPVYIHVTGLKDQNKEIHDWMVRIEDKIDHLAECVLLKQGIK